MENNKSEMVPVPLPTEIPAPPSLENLPLDILHSATVEMLIQQNEDLSSRLKVNIRRNSQLELKIIELEKEIKNAQRQSQNLQAQNEIIQEKEKIWLSQKEEKGRQQESLEKELELLNLRYNELFTTSNQNQKQQQAQLALKQNEIKNLQKKLKVLNRLRLRAKDRLRQFLLNTAESFNSHYNQIKVSQSSNRILKKNFEDLKNEITEKEEFFKSQLEEFKVTTQKNLDALTDRNQELVLTNDQLRAQQKEQKQELNELDRRFTEEKRNRIKLKHLNQEVDSMKNERIELRRELSDQKEKYEELRQVDLEKNKRASNEAQELQKQLTEQKATLETCENKMLELAKDNKEISTQLDSLQKLWIEAQEKLEKEELKRKSLEKINRELSQSYKDKRVQRSIERSQETPSTEAKDTEAPIQDRLSEVYASQYAPMTKGPTLDL